MSRSYPQVIRSLSLPSNLIILLFFLLAFIIVSCNLLQVNAAPDGAFRYVGLTSAGSANGTDWANRWAYDSVPWATVTTLATTQPVYIFLDGGATYVEYHYAMSVGGSGSSDTNRIYIMPGYAAQQLAVPGTHTGHTGQVIWDLQGNARDGISLNNQSYITIDGYTDPRPSGANTSKFILRNANGANDLIRAYNTSHITLRHLELYKTVNTYAGDAINMTRTQPSTDAYHIVEYNYIHDGGWWNEANQTFYCGTWTDGYNYTIIRYNEYKDWSWGGHGNSGEAVGFYFGHQTGGQVYNNIFDHVGVATRSVGQVRFNTFYNTEFSYYANNTLGENIYLENNIFYLWNSNSIRTAGTDNTYISGNVFYNTGAEAGAIVKGTTLNTLAELNSTALAIIQKNNVAGNSNYLQDVSTHKFNLTSDATNAINYAYASNWSAPNDFLNVSRPQGTASDVGAYEYIPLTVTINQASAQDDPSSNSTINFTVIFSASVSDFATGDVTLSGTAGATTATVTGSGTTYNVAVTGMTAPGTVIASIGSGLAHDAGGKFNDASTSTDHTVNYYTSTRATYYVDSQNGEDYDTTCLQAQNPATPKKTVYYANQCNPQPGDKILLKGAFTEIVYPRTGAVIYPVQSITQVSDSQVTFNTTLTDIDVTSDYVTIYNSRKGNSGAFKIISQSEAILTVDTSDLPSGHFLLETSSDPGDLQAAVIRPVIYTAWDRDIPPVWTGDGYAFEIQGRNAVMLSYLRSDKGQNSEVWPAIRLVGTDGPNNYIVLDHLEVRYAETALNADASDNPANYAIVQHNYFHDTGRQGDASDEVVYWGNYNEGVQEASYPQFMYNKIGPNRYTSDIVGDGIELKPNGDFGTIFGNEIFGIVPNGCDDAPIKTSGESTFISNNYIHDIINGITNCGISINGGPGLADNSIVVNNIIANVKDTGIQILAAANVLVANNTIYNITSSSQYSRAISAFDWSLPVSNLVISNNIIHTAIIGIGRNNSGAGLTATTDHNIVYDAQTPFDEDFPPSATDLTSNPQLVNPSAGDFSILINSPAYNSGADLTSYFSIDNHDSSNAGLFDLVPQEERNTLWDRGAYEFSDSVAPVTTSVGTDVNWHRTNVTVTLSCNDSNASGCAYTYYTTDGSDPTTGSSEGTSIVLVSDGIYTIKYFSVDNYDNTESIKTAPNSVKIDKTVPTGSIVINTGEATTTTRNATLTLSSADTGSGSYQMEVSENSGFTGASWETFATSKSFTLSSTEGLKTVYARFKDVAGNISTTYLDTITYDLPESNENNQEATNNSTEETTTETTAEEELVSFSLKIVDENGNPLPGVILTLHSTPVTKVTGSDGIAQFTNIEKGLHDLTIEYNNIVSQTQVSIDKTITLTKPLEIRINTNSSPVSSPASYTSGNISTANDLSVWFVVGLAIVISGVLFLVVKSMRRKSDPF